MDGASMMLLIALASDQATGTLHQLVTGQVTGLIAMVTAEVLIGAALYWRFGREPADPPEPPKPTRTSYEGRHRLPRRTPQRIPDWRTLELARFADEEATRELHVLTDHQQQGTRTDA